ncbi:TIGR03089 family protein [Nocardioides cynanchi]|uniref:TIGR03089 family protein n=1 Tax=Nocardioides cynanchi TaxID=2558918 RepID=UPI001248CC11|nr:TIGR03089 family protein [Nocardioides cynanchi]
MTTFPQVLSGLLAAGGARPLVTFYDDATGERTELSVTTYANWVAKVSSLLVEELDLERGGRLLVDLPAHWLGTVALGAAWNCGLEVVWEGDADAVLTGPGGLDRWAGLAGGRPVVATALQPLAGRFTEPLPAGVHDLGVEVWSQPDAFVPWSVPEPGDAAVPGLNQAELWRAAAAGQTRDGGRLLSESNPASPSGLVSFTGPLLSNGSLVLVVNASVERSARIAADERVSDRFDPDQSARS